MFTGIIPAVGRIVEVKNIKHGRWISVKTELKIVRKVPAGGSISVDGVCLTAVARKLDTLQFELMDSTLNLTTLGALKKGDRVNVEPAMRASDMVGGHFISGHVDRVAMVRKVSTRWHTRYVVVDVPCDLHHYLVPQGSVVVNGVALTIVEVGDVRRTVLRSAGGRSSEYQPWFSVALTAYTLAHTNMGTLKVGDNVNIETDLFAKYIINFLNLSSRGRSRGDLTGLPRRLRAPRNDGVYEVSHRRGKV